LGGRVLDIGVGQGRNALPLAERGFAVIGIDPAAGSIEATRAAAQEHQLAIDLWRGSVFDYQPEEGSFAAILLFGLLQTLWPADGRALIDRLYRWTSPQGLCFVTAWHVDDPRFTELAQTRNAKQNNSFEVGPDRVHTYLERNETS